MSTDTVDTRTQPQNVEAEQAVLGGMLLSKDAIADVVTVLKGGAMEFYVPSHAVIFDTIIDLYAHGKPADPVSVTSALAASGDLARIGGAPYLHTLVNRVPTAANAGHYAVAVTERYLQRALIEAGTRIVQKGWELAAGNGRTAVEVIDESQQMLYGLTADNRDSDGLSAFAGLFQPTLDEIETAGQYQGRLRGIPSGFRDLDRLLNGFRGGQLITVAGRTSMGKSTAATDFARCAGIGNRLPTLYFTCEMSRVDWMERVLAAECRVPLTDIISGNLDDRAWQRLTHRMGEISEAPMFVDDSPSPTLMEIRAKSRRLKQRENLQLVIVDHIGLMTPPKAETRQLEVSALTRGLKILSKEIDCPVIEVCQVNRQPADRGDKRPQLTDLRASGSVEDDSDVVIFVHRDDYYDKSIRPGEADFIVAKHRNGPTDVITVAAQLHYARFVDVAFDDR